MFGCYNRGMQRTPIAAELAERREAPRIEVDGRYSTRLDPCDGRAPITCTLLDHSITAMRIELPDNDALPEQVQVLIGKLSHKARTVWRKGNVVGIDFIDEHHPGFSR
ncbi:MAG: PilZ domain-containing protein [Alphaproteobacteria bacterium]|nr:PilZ domain-containing protein [Alphaproteobacteria bacterium]